MLSIGILYLLFSQRMTSFAGEGSVATQSTIAWSRIVIGAQVGLIMLAMIVTRSSIASIRAKHGLPIGNQVVGWTVLGGYLRFDTLWPTLTCENSHVAFHTLSPSLVS